MIVNWLRENKIAAGILGIIRIYLGYTWFTAGLGKVTGGEFNAGGYLGNAVANPVMDKATNEPIYGWYVSFLEGIALPNAELFTFLVAWGEVLVGLGLLLGCLTTAAAFFGITMNFAFMFAGTVSTNPQMVLLTIFLLVAGYNAGRFGLDRFVLPFIKKQLGKGKESVTA